MPLKIHFLLLTLAIFSCTNNKTKNDTSKDEIVNVIQTSNSVDIDADFNSFIITFSTDKSFQLERTKFPLYTKQYDVGNDRDTVIYRDRSQFEMIDFRQNKSNGQYDEWTQEIVLDKGNRKATIQIRGIENGIMVNYDFKKVNGKWMLIGVDDAST